MAAYIAFGIEPKHLLRRRHHDRTRHVVNGKDARARNRAAQEQPDELSCPKTKRKTEKEENLLARSPGERPMVCTWFLNIAAMLIASCPDRASGRHYGWSSPLVSLVPRESRKDFLELSSLPSRG